MTAIPLLVPTISFRGAYTDDVAVMTRMINGYAAVGLMRPRNPEELLRRLEEFVVATEVDGSVAACGGLRADGFRRAEIVSLAVREDLRGRGLGGQVLDKLVENAGARGIETVLATTRREGFFRLRGFHPTHREPLGKGLIRGPGGRRVVVERRLNGTAEPAAPRCLVSC